MIVAIFAVLFGLVGAYAVKRYMQPPVAKEKDKEGLRFVPMAGVDLEPGRAVTLTDIVIAKMTPSQMKQKGLPAEFMTNPEQIIGRVLRDPLAKGGVFLTTSLYPEGMGPDISQRLKPGLRAVTVSIEGTGIVGGLARPGAIADVVFRANASDSGSIPETTVTLLEKVEVLAVGQNTVLGKANSGNPTMVTLAVNPVQANTLKVTENRGTFSLSLRNDKDDTIATDLNAPSTLEGVLNLEPKLSFTTEIYRAGARQKTTFAGDELVKQEVFDAPIAPAGRSRTPSTLVKQVEPDTTPDAVSAPTAALTP
jgi:pilus assembly protein CpaB